MQEDSVNNCECLRCGHKWTRRVPQPIRCAKCASYIWDKIKPGDPKPAYTIEPEQKKERPEF